MKEMTAIRRIAPEDIAPGVYVVLHQSMVVDRPGFLDRALGATARPDRYLEVPEGMQPPMRVVGVCLPYVLCETPHGYPVQFDLRRHVLARLDARYAYDTVKRLRRLPPPSGQADTDDD